MVQRRRPDRDHRARRAGHKSDRWLLRSARRSLLVVLSQALVLGTLIALSAVSSPPAGASSSVPITYTYSGSTVEWGPAPSSENIEVLAVGAAGGSNFYGGNSSTGADIPGGEGGAELATLSVSEGESLDITVGAVGGNTVAYFSGGGGYGGGGGGGGGGDENAPGGAGGGGATTITNASSGATLLVAGGGGGAGGPDCEYTFISGCTTSGGDEYPNLGGGGGSGGGSSGGAGAAGAAGSDSGGSGGGGGTISSGGAGGSQSGSCSGGSGTAGHGGSGIGACFIGSGGGGGGGGGYYGGGAGGSGGSGSGTNSAGGGGGGGSSYANATFTTSSQSENDVEASDGYVEIAQPGSIGLPLIGGAITAAEGQGGGPSTECSCVATTPIKDPVNAMDGDFYESATDFSVPGPGVPLNFVRTYDANMAQTSGGTGNTSDLGPGWTDNLAMNVTTVEGMATVTEVDGAKVQFSAYNSANPWCSSTYNYCPVAPRDIATLNQNMGGTWTFTDNMSSLLTYTFSSSGALSQITNAAGQSITASSETPGSGSGSSACPSSATSCTVWTSNASTSSPTLTEVFTSGELTEVIGFATSGTPPPARPSATTTSQAARRPVDLRAPWPQLPTLAGSPLPTPTTKPTPIATSTTTC